MIMPPRLRKFALTAHVTSTVGWLGAVAGVFALAVAGLASQDAQLVRSAYLAIEVTAFYVLVPLAFASLLTGIVQALGTTWGLFRHYWVLLKLLITVLATFALLMHVQAIGTVAGVAAERALSSADFRALRIEFVANPALALVAMLAAVTLGVYKPQGMTRYGQRKQQRKPTQAADAARAVDATTKRSGAQ